MKTYILLCSLLLVSACTSKHQVIPVVYTSPWHEEVKVEAMNKCSKESHEIALVMTGAKIAENELQTRGEVVYYFSVINKLLMDSCIRFYMLDI